ncbi:MAG: TetR/AcrR family transcriptional regulator [Desulfuromonadales bacterium]|nr:TetR/AcrR family transcriptional regulator [Desulfuromonadales bacterium]
MKQAEKSLDRQPGKKSDKRSAVIQAALEIIAEQGFHNSPTSLIAQRAQVGMGTIYRYFKSKDDLICAIFEERFVGIRSFVLKDYKEDSPLRDRYQQLCSNLFAYMAANATDYKFYEQYRNSPFGTQTQMERLLAFETAEEVTTYPFLMIFREGAEQGQIKPLPLAILAALTFGPIFSLVGSDLHGGLTVGAKEVEMTVSACWDAIAQR